MTDYVIPRAIRRRAMRQAGFRGSKSNDHARPSEAQIVGWSAQYVLETKRREEHDPLPLPGPTGELDIGRNQEAR